MSELMKYTAKTIANTDNDSTTKVVGGALVKTGVGTGGAMLLAGALPFVTLPMIIILMVIFGGYLYLK